MVWFGELVPALLVRLGSVVVVVFLNVPSDVSCYGGPDGRDVQPMQEMLLRKVDGSWA